MRSFSDRVVFSRRFFLLGALMRVCACEYYSAFKILVYTLKVSTKELFLMVVFLISGVLVFASLIHYIEQNNFPNIPIGI